MSTRSSLVTATVLFVVCSSASAEAHWDASLAGLADENESQSLDGDVAFAPVDWLQFGVGGGSTTSPSTVGSLDGTNFRGSVDLNSERLGLRGYYRQWNSQMLDTDTLGARASVVSGGFTFSFGGEARGFDVDYLTGGSDSQRSTQHFSGSGWGGGLTYSRAGWTGYADAMFYDYGSLSRYVTTNSSSVVPVAGPTPGTPSLPLPSLLDTVRALPVGSGALSDILPVLPQAVLAVAPVLTSSIVTLEQGALDHLYTAGITRDFTRVSLHLDWTNAKDVILSSTTNSYRAGVGYAFNDHLRADVSAGVTDSYLGSAAFGGASVGFSF